MMTLEQLRAELEELHAAYRHQPSDSLLNEIFNLELAITSREQATDN